MDLKNINTIVLDLNGTLYERGIAVKGANDTIKILRQNGYHLTFITNTDGRNIDNVYTSVIKKGLEIEKEELFTPVTAVKAFISEKPGKTFYPLVSNSVIKDLQGINMDDKHPDYVIIGDFADKVSFDEINKVFRMIKNGSEIVALSKTLWYIDVDGCTINTGAFVSMFETACAKEAVLMGKPSVGYFNMGLKRTGSRPETSLIVGDDVTTDILGAKRVNAAAVLVRTGIYNETDLVNAEYKPDYVIDDVNGLIELLSI